MPAETSWQTTESARARVLRTTGDARARVQMCVCVCCVRLREWVEVREDSCGPRKEEQKQSL